jgi:hypothetical protein
MFPVGSKVCLTEPSGIGKCPVFEEKASINIPRILRGNLLPLDSLPTLLEF